MLIDDVLNNEKMQKLEDEITQLNQLIPSLSAQVRVRQRSMIDMLEANCNLLSANLLLEEEMKKCKNELQSALDRCKDLEK